ncbi:MAG: rRNA maturation RNase YbeY [Pseudomonadota bacterium]
MNQARSSNPGDTLRSATSAACDTIPPSETTIGSGLDGAVGAGPTPQAEAPGQDETLSDGLVELVVEHPGWLAALPDLIDHAGLAARLALVRAGVNATGREIAILACDNTRIAALNADFRGKPTPTNVLSWPAEDLAPPAPGQRPPAPSRAHGPLGDIAIALETTRSEAEKAGIGLKDHVIHLILHGTLHLIGYDHETNDDAALMEGIERAAVTGLGMRDPYGKGAAGPTRRD